MKILCIAIFFALFSVPTHAYDFSRFSDIFQQFQENGSINTDEGHKKFVETLKEEAERQNRQYKKEDLGNPHYKIEGFK